ncbi:MAG: 50S ribosomal protein L25 [bacterium]
MAIQFTLDAQKREAGGKGAARRLRAEGSTPAIIYGKRETPLAISFNTNEFLKLVHGEAHENVLFKVKIKGHKGKDVPNVVIKEMQLDPTKGNLLHVDLFEVSMDKVLEVHVPVETINEAIGVKEEGGLLDHVAREILVECLPDDLPESIEIDVSPLKMGDAVHIKDIVFPSGVKPLESPDKVIVTIIHKLKVKEEIVTKVPEEEEEAPEVLTQKSSKPAEEE